MHDLFRSLIWPAVAGNIAWSFFSLAWGEPWSSAAPRLITLGLVAWYLMLSWTWTENCSNSDDYIFLDALFAVAITAFSIASHDKCYAASIWASVWLAIVFLVALLGHFFFIWEPKSLEPKRKNLLIANGVGIAILIVCWILWPSGILWHRPIAIFYVVVIWASEQQVSQNKELKGLHSGQTELKGSASDCLSECSLGQRKKSWRTENRS